ncbi:MAG: CARDB domain-containing protein [Anaerolineales bacterium]
MKTLIRYYCEPGMVYRGILIMLAILLLYSTAAAQEDSNPYPPEQVPDSTAVLVEINGDEFEERTAELEPQPLIVDPNPGQSIIPNPGPAVPEQFANPVPEPLPETPDQPQMPSALVDLIVVDIWSTTNPLQAGQEENVTFQIKNQGTEAISTTFFIRFSLDGVVKATWSSGGLSAGQIAQASIPVTVNSTGNHEVKIEVDFTDLIAETNESNNVRTETWVWGTSPVDLIVVDIWSTTNPLQAGQEENVTFQIKNEGTEAISTSFFIRFSLDGVVKATWSSGGLSAGQIAQASTLVIVNSSGNHEVKIEVDYDDRIVESNESNNIRTETWVWGTSPVDLIVEDIWSSTNPLRAGEVEQIIYSIRNTGTEAVPVNFNSQLLIDGSSVGTASISGLAAGTSVTRSINVTVGTPGDHEVKVIVDHTLVVPEFNESNNSRVENWIWQERPVDLIVTDIWSMTNPLQAGMVENVTFEIMNQGPVGTPSTFYALLLVDGSPVDDVAFSGIDAGGTLTADLEVQVNHSGLHELIVIVDHTNLIPETNEGNNDRMESWTWQPSPFDLVIDDVWSTTEPLKTGSIETIYLQIRNQGTVAIERVFEARLSVGEIFNGTVQINGLPPGAAIVKSFDILVTNPGVHEVHVIADHTDVVVESDETNNDWVENWEWTGDNLLVLPLLFSDQ